MKLNLHHKIVTYHDFEANSNFEIQLQILARKSNVAITVDDGHISFYNVAFPLLKQYNIPSILFIVPSLIGTDTPFWWDEIYYYQGRQAGAAVIRKLKTIPNKERIDYLENLRKTSDKPLLKQQQLTIEQLQELQSNGVFIANHSFTHPMFDQCSETELREEMQKTKVFFKENKLDGYSIFAYPNGSNNVLAERILKEEGIEYAFLFDHKLNRGKINPMRISRLSVDDRIPNWKFKLILSGWHTKIVPISKALNTIMRK